MSYIVHLLYVIISSHIKSWISLQFLRSLRHFFHISSSFFSSGLESCIAGFDGLAKSGSRMGATRTVTGPCWWLHVSLMWVFWCDFLHLRTAFTANIFHHISFVQTRKPNNAVQCFYQRTAEPHQTCPTSACMPPNSKHTLRETECDCVQTKHTNEPINN
jgi:hypothetical protein